MRYSLRNSFECIEQFVALLSVRGCFLLGDFESAAELRASRVKDLPEKLNEFHQAAAEKLPFQSKDAAWELGFAADYAAEKLSFQSKDVDLRHVEIL